MAQRKPTRRPAAEAKRPLLAVMADDGEKFGIWPQTHEPCYQNGWLERFFSTTGPAAIATRLRAAAALREAPAHDKPAMASAAWRADPAPLARCAPCRSTTTGRGATSA